MDWGRESLILQLHGKIVAMSDGDRFYIIYMLNRMSLVGQGIRDLDLNFVSSNADSLSSKVATSSPPKSVTSIS